MNTGDHYQYDPENFNSYPGKKVALHVAHSKDILAEGHILEYDPRQRSLSIFSKLGEKPYVGYFDSVIGEAKNIILGVDFLSEEEEKAPEVIYRAIFAQYCSAGKPIKSGFKQINCYTLSVSSLHKGGYYWKGQGHAVEAKTIQAFVEMQQMIDLGKPILLQPGKCLWRTPEGVILANARNPELDENKKIVYVQ